MRRSCNVLTTLKSLHLVKFLSLIKRTLSIVAVLSWVHNLPILTN